MADIVISDQDLRNADTFLTSYLSTKIPDADFSEGSAVRDFVIKGIAYVFAYLERERKITRDRQSLLSLANLPAGESVDDAVDALLSNWFLSRKTGAAAVVPVTLHFSQAVDVELTTVTRFFRTSTQVFVPNAISSFVIPASELRATVNPDGTIQDYTVNVNLVAVDQGAAGNVSPGRFANADPFNAFFLFAENLVTGSGGKDVETSAEMLERAPTAISVRNLINVRSIETVLREAFPVDDVIVVGMGDPEMMRDYTAEIANIPGLHVGGYTDIYIKAGRTETVETLTLGAAYARPDGLAVVLRDAATTFTGLVTPGNVLRVHAGLANTPREFIIRTVRAHELEVQPRMAFSRATDEDGDTVDYTIGTLSPGFDDVIAGPVTTGETSRKLQEPAAVVLAGRPVYKIVSVEVVDGATVTALTERTNLAPTIAQFQVECLTPHEAQSARAVTLVRVHSSYDGKSLRVRYETQNGYDAVQAFVSSDLERVVTANQLVKALHPVYVSVNLSFRLRVGATATVREADVVSAVEDFINTFDAAETLAINNITRHVETAFPDIGVIFSPVSLTYSLLAPDGQVYSYSTLDAVSIFPSSENTARLTNGAALRTAIPDASLPSIPENAAALEVAHATLQAQLRALGVSDRNVQYIAVRADLTATLRT